jgi:hypothetical protein
MFKIILLFSLSLVSLQAQDHLNLWTRITFSKKFSNSFKTDIEFQHRRQNNLESYNPFDKNLMSSFRVWNTFQLNKKSSISISPFAVFRNFTIIESIKDGKKTAITEYRFAGAFDFAQPISKNWFITNRAGIEYRIYEAALSNQIRIRNRIGVKYQWNKAKQQLYLFDEPFANIVGAIDNKHIYDHNRIGILYSHNITNSLKFDVGYIYIDRLTRNHIESIEDSNFLLNLMFQL